MFMLPLFLNPVGRLLVDLYKPEPEENSENDPAGAVLDTISKTCMAVQDKFHRSMPLLQSSAKAAGLSFVATATGVGVLASGVPLVGYAALTPFAALGIGAASAVASVSYFVDAIKA